MPWEKRAFYANGSDTRIGFSLERGRRRLPLLDHDVEGDECALDAAAVDAVLDGFLRDVVGDAVRAQHLEPLGQVEAAAASAATRSKRTLHFWRMMPMPNSRS